ncbi:MAG: peptidoglycan-associated lipoprotein Pal [Rickettsiaceae bacterium]|nr:peptidoglycan-associated lipoprotein Pal [Rickettsiaceae bacterium]
MFNKFAAAFCILLALSGCSSKKHSHASESLINDFEKNVGDRVYFALNKHSLTHEAMEQLDKQIAWLTSSDSKAKIQVVVEGHCDERGTREYNLALGEKRANAVKHYLTSKGVNSDRIEVTSYGKEKPAAIGNTEEVYKLNRRAVTVVK